MAARFSRDAKEWLALGALFVGVFALLAVVGPNARGIPWAYLLSVLATILLYSLFAMGLSLEFGSTGLLNFGHVAFMAVGAYGVAIFMDRWGLRLAGALEGATAWGFLAALLVGLVVAGLVALPLNLALGMMRRGSARTRTLVAIGGGLVVALVLTLVLFPFSSTGAVNAAVFIAILLAVLLAAALGVLLGLPALRLREDYLAIVTIGAAEILRSVIVNEDEWTNGTLGLVNLRRPITEWALATPWWADVARALDVPRVALANAIVFALTLAFVFLVLQTLARSPWGRVLKAIREDEEVASSLGKNVLSYKLQSLAIGSAIAAVAGVFFSWHLSTIHPEHYLPIVTFYAFIILVIGGIGNHKGALAGAILLWGIFELAGNLGALEKYGLKTVGPPQLMVIGVLLILVMLFRPQGILGRKEEMQFVK